MNSVVKITGWTLVHNWHKDTTVETNPELLLLSVGASCKNLKITVCNLKKGEKEPKGNIFVC